MCSIEEENKYLLFAAPPFFISHQPFIRDLLFPVLAHPLSLPDMNCAAKVFVMSFLYARSKPNGSR